MIIKLLHAYFAESAGIKATELSFSLSTGLGVSAGHTLYMAGKKAITGNADIGVGKELDHVGKCRCLFRWCLASELFALSFALSNHSCVYSEFATFNML